MQRKIKSKILNSDREHYKNLSIDILRNIRRDKNVWPFHVNSNRITKIADWNDINDLFKPNSLYRW